MTSVSRKHVISGWVYPNTFSNTEN